MQAIWTHIYHVFVKNDQSGDFCILSDTHLIDCDVIKEALLLAHRKVKILGSRFHKSKKERGVSWWLKYALQV